MKSFLIITFFFVLSISVFSQEVYRYKVENLKQLHSSNPYIIYDKHNNSLREIYFNYIFTGNYEKVDIFKNDSLTKGFVLENSKLVSSAKFGDNIINIILESKNIYLLIMTPEGDIIGKDLIHTLLIPEALDKIKIIPLVDKEKYLVSIGESLISVSYENKNKVSTVEMLTQINGALLELDNESGLNLSHYATVQESDNSITVNFYNHKNEFLFLTNLPLQKKYKWVDIGTELVYVTSPAPGQSFIQIIDKNSGTISHSFWIDSDINLITFYKTNTEIFVKYINYMEDTYFLNVIKLIGEGKKEQIFESPLSNSTSEPFYLLNNDGLSILLLTNAIAVFDKEHNLIANVITKLPKRIFSDEPTNKIKCTNFDETFIVYNDLGGIKFTMAENSNWILDKFVYEFRNYAIIILLILLLMVFIQLYRHQRRVAKEILELPTVGLLFVVDSNGRVTQLNGLAKEFLEINESTPKRKFFRFYARSEKTMQFADLIDRGVESRENFTKKISIKINDSETEWFCKVIALRNLTGMFRGVVLSAIDITEQLERKRLSNWAQLAHDMQTNLSTIKLNAEHLDIAISENNKSRQKRIIFQVSLLMQRVRDIVTVGRNENLNLEQTSLFELFTSVRNEFDELMFPNITFEIEKTNLIINCDKAKLIRAVRNAAENGIKAIKEKDGKITLRAKSNVDFVIITIEDNGPGMDDEIKKKMLTPYFTTGTKTGGSGIGTMIMQHVAELHKGKIVVESELGIGTKVNFFIPHKIDQNS